MCFLSIRLFRPAIAAAATALLTALPAVAGEPVEEAETNTAAPQCSCPEANGKPVKPKFAGWPSSLDESDEIAALASVHHALGHAADGTKYVWHRNNGRLSGIVHPTSSFRNGDGSVCRHVIVMLTTGFITKKAEGTACRSTGGRWQFEG